jgi:mRNA interferase MazF
LKRGDVIIVVHGDFGRPRPAVVVQADELGDATTTVLVCPITSRVTERLPIRPAVEASPENGLRVRSQIMTDKIVAVRREGLRDVIGTIAANTTRELDRALLIVLGLAR